MLWTLVAVGAMLAAQSPEPRLTAVAANVERALRDARVPGASFAIVSGGRTLTGHYGLADAQRGVAMTPATLLQVGSLNKLMTALALSATLQERNIGFDEPIGAHVPGLQTRLRSVTFHQLLSQTSGLRDHAGAVGTNDEGALGARVRAIADDDFVLPAGTVFSYSNLGYAAAGFALEHLRQKPYADALREAVLAPLLMRTSTMRPGEASRRPQASGHRLDTAAGITLTETDNDTSIWPAGYLWTTAEELQMPLEMLASGASRVTQRQGMTIGLPQPLLARATAPHTSMPNIFVGGHYGYGLMLGTDRGVRIYEHGGTQRGFSSLLRVAPERRFGIVILTNLDGAPLRRIAQEVMADALGLPAMTPPPRTETPLTSEQMTGMLGVYRNRGTAELAVRDDRIVLILDGGPPMAVSRVGDDRYLARPRPEVAGPEFVLQPAGGSRPAYLHFALWAYTKSTK